MTDITKTEQNARGGLSNSILASVYRKLCGEAPVACYRPLNLPPDPEPVEEHKAIAEWVFCEMPNGLYRKSIIAESVYAKPANILTFSEAVKAGQVYTLPKTMDAPFECIDNKEVGRVSQTIWILIYSNGRVVTHVPTPTSGRLLLGGDIMSIDNPADPMPADVFKAIKVVLGTELIDNSLRGCRWAHYMKETYN